MPNRSPLNLAIRIVTSLEPDLIAAALCHVPNPFDALVVAGLIDLKETHHQPTCREHVYVELNADWRWPRRSMPRAAGFRIFRVRRVHEYHFATKDELGGARKLGYPAKSQRWQ